MIDFLAVNVAKVGSFAGILLFLKVYCLLLINAAVLLPSMLYVTTELEFWPSRARA